MNRSVTRGLGAALLFLATSCRAACPDAATIDAYVADYAAARPSVGLGADLSFEDARCARAHLVDALSSVMGERVGYKAAFTNPALQKRFGMSEPAWGVMYGRMMFADGAVVPAGFGAIPMFEADFAVVVKDDGLADANTPLEALAHLTAVVPFIELPDLMLRDKPSGPALVAANVGSRGGVLGPRVPVEVTPEFVDALANMTVVMTDEASGQELTRAPGRVIMDNPLHSAIWLAKALRRDGIRLRPGDVLSLGGFGPPSTPKAGMRATVYYKGLPGDPSVSVRFE